MILEHIGLFDVTLRLISIQTLTSVLKVSTLLITSIKAARPIGLVAILEIMPVSTVKSDVIINIYQFPSLYDNLHFFLYTEHSNNQLNQVYYD